MKKVCLIGYGKWGKVLLKKIKNIFSVRIILRKKNYSLKKIRPAEWVIISTPDETHYKIVKDCIKLKKNIFCEKPLVRKFDYARNLYKLAKINRVKLAVSDLSSFYNKKVSISNKINIFKRFKNSPQDKYKNGKRYDLLYRLAYHDIGYIYEKVKAKKLKLIKIIRSKKILIFHLLFDRIKFVFFYDSTYKKKIHTLNEISLIQDRDILKEMLNNFIIKGKSLTVNKKKSLFIIKTLEKIKKKIYLSKA